jgi:hypothetical protein
VEKMKKIAICMSLLIGQVWALSCTTPVTISEPGLDVLAPKITIDEKGEVLALWASTKPKSKKKTLCAATRDEKKWSTAALSEPFADIHFLDEFIDDQGNLFVYWKIKLKNGEGKKLKCYQFAKKAKNQLWSPAITMIGLEDKLTYSRFTFDAQGNGLLFGNLSTTRDIVSLLYSHQNGEVKKMEAAKTGGVLNSQKWLKNQRGKVFAWWEGYEYGARGRPDHSEIVGSWLQDDGHWSTPVTLFPINEPYLYLLGGAMNSKGDLVLLWGKAASGYATTIQAATCFNGQWSEPVDLTVWSSPVPFSDSIKDAKNTAMSIDDLGNILIAWVVRDGRKDVYAAYKPVDQEWVAPVRLSSGAHRCDHLKVETNHQGSFAVLWNERQKKQSSIYGAALSTATKEWTFAIVSPEGQDCGDFEFAFNKQGQGVIAWETTWDDGDSSIQVAELNVN